MDIDRPRGIDEPPDRFAIVWRAKWWIIGATALVTALTYVVSSVIPPTYGATANVLVSAVAPSGLTKEAVDATNELASQYAQLVDGNDVIAPAAGSLGMSESALKSSISAGTVAAQNIVEITGTASTAGAAQARANAVADAFVARQRQRNAQLVDAYNGLVSAVARQLNPSISRTIAQLSSPSAAVKAAAASNLAVLLNQRQQLAVTSAQASAYSQPLLSVYNLAPPGTKVLPKPTLYAGIALIISFVIAAQLAAAIGARRVVRRIP